MAKRHETLEEFQSFVEAMESRPDNVRPLAFGLGIAHVGSDGAFLDTYFPVVNYDGNFGTAAVFALLVGHYTHGTRTFEVNTKFLEDALDLFACFEGDGKKHANIDLIRSLLDSSPRPQGKKLVVSFIGPSKDDQGPQHVADAYLRLHLLSHRFVKPHGINLDGIFGILQNVAWTSAGPVSLEDLPGRQLAARMKGAPLVVHAVDKFPRMADYVVPSGVRIADASRVRLGAYLGEGTTVMHEGFSNFNAGTFGKSMVEGRISAGVVVGDGTDVGGGASIMGTLSGGGKEVIAIGERCLIGANAGTGISLGDDCIIEAGCYITAGTKVSYLAHDAVRARPVKALELSGKPGLLFRRNSTTGIVEAIPNKNAIELNEVLHANG